MKFSTHRALWGDLKRMVWPLRMWVSRRVAEDTYFEGFTIVGLDGPWSLRNCLKWLREQTEELQAWKAKMDARGVRWDAQEPVLDDLRRRVETLEMEPRVSPLELHAQLAEQDRRRKKLRRRIRRLEDRR